MNMDEILILILNKNTNKFEDKTSTIDVISQMGENVDITFTGSITRYTYNRYKVQVFNSPKRIDIENTIVCIDAFPQDDCIAVLHFDKYIKLFYKEKSPLTYHSSRVSFENSCLNLNDCKVVFDYLKKLSSFNVMKDGKSVLLKQYEDITTVSEESVLASYLSGRIVNGSNDDIVPIFPFGVNVSQKKAVKAALNNKISVIEGPPGTGKTQTILNIIANIVSNGKTIGLVSGNNSATLNVQEKLEKEGFGFITALLGNTENQKNFFSKESSTTPPISNWKVEKEEYDNLTKRLLYLAEELENLLNDQNKIAKLREMLSKLLTEQSYFENNFEGEYISINEYSLSKRWTSNRVMDFLFEFEHYILEDRLSRFGSKVNLLVKYKIIKYKYINSNKDNIVKSLRRDYYSIKISACKKEIQELEKRLETRNFSVLIKEYQAVSLDLFKNALYNRYYNLKRNSYSSRNFKANFQNFISEYPVILSTTNSIMNSIPKNYLFDYIIIDEASQVDIVTASLALACCRQVVIVGDIKQLPQIVTGEIEKLSSELFYKSKLQEAYSFSKYSIIASLMRLFGESLPITLLTEHYRCHPKIIGFCNEKYYDNQLVIMTEENPDDKPLRIYKTVPGNHARRVDNIDEKGWFNQRQIEVVRDEILINTKYKGNDYKDIGIISPYRMHVHETKKQIPNNLLEVDTVHKYQGREKNTIIFTTVANDMNHFIDNANLINVAVSRAVKELIIVTSNKLFNQHGSNIGDLLRYIKYNTLDNDIIESKKTSVFDLLYSEYTETLLQYRKSMKNVSKYISENLMYSIVEEVLNVPQFRSFKCVLHVPLHSIVKEYSYLNAEETKFARNPWTHVDFLIYNKLDKEPVLVVEVDGYRYHRNKTEQKRRDLLKDCILQKIDIAILRIATNESGEKAKLESILEEIIKISR